MHFSSHHDDYHSAYKYAAKEDKELIHSSLHPNLEAIKSPRTKTCTKAYHQRSRSKREADRQGKEEGDLKKKRRRMPNLEVSDFLIKNNINNALNNIDNIHNMGNFPLSNDEITVLNRDSVLS